MYNCKILCVLDDGAVSSPVVRSLEAAGCEIVTVTNPLHAAAVAFIKRNLDAVVLDTASAEPGLRVARAIRSVRRDLPILLVSCNLGPDLPPYVDACVCARDDDAMIIRVLQALTGRVAADYIPELTGMRPQA